MARIKFLVPASTFVDASEGGVLSGIVDLKDFATLQGLGNLLYIEHFMLKKNLGISFRA